MLQKVMCGYTTPISKFKANPGAVLGKAEGEAVAVSSHNQIQFYAVPAILYEEMVNLIELKKRRSVAPETDCMTPDGVDVVDGAVRQSGGAI